TTVAAYSGTLVSSLSALGGWCTPYEYRCIEVRAAAGQTMSIAVDGTNGGAHSGQTTLHWVQVPSPANDAFASAQQISGLSGDVTGTTTGATSELGEPGYVSRSVWYRFTPAWSGPWSVTITQPPNQNVYVYTGSSLGALQSAPSTADYEAYDLTAGVEYRIQVDGSQYPGPFTLHWAKLPPENDAEFDA